MSSTFQVETTNQGTVLVPLRDQVLVRVFKQAEEASEMTRGGIIVPEIARRSRAITHRGLVIEVGPSPQLELRRGDEVLFDRYSGVELWIDGDLHLIMREASVLLYYRSQDE